MGLLDECLESGTKEDFMEKREGSGAPNLIPPTLVRGFKSRILKLSVVWCAPAPPPPHQKKNKTKQKTAKSANFSVTKEDDVHQYVVRNPLNKEGMKRRTIVHKIQYFVAPCALQHRYWHNTLKK